MTTAPPAARTTLSVVICAYTLDRWDDLCAAVDSVRGQRRPPEELVLVVDHCPELARRAEQHWPGVRVLPNEQRRGLSGARNTGVRAVGGDVVAFLDDDAVAAPDWADRLLDGYRDPAVLGVGGYVRPRWETGRPAWFPGEFDWVVGCSYLGLPERPATIRNFTGANMSFRRAEAVSAGGFRLDLGRIGTRPVGCEETEFCLRLAARHPDAQLRYDPAAVVHHHVPPGRATWAYFRARCYAEGRSKAVVARHTGPRPALASERRYLRHTLPAAVLRHLRRADLRSAGALCAGAGITLLGYTVGRAALLLPRPSVAVLRSARSPR
ncbi:glycosyltransferase family 2 protein [Kitasatospora sp. DSM 101779]|uniref:glycosyltransferase family 2 protein n=1 Tax=Kitasatospora sp. DSM 101779 TaxID=2853165 RepID=UPI0021DB4331|nr:glycosyltransferase family 2 protein [Kitasatospora sp. DSM 101779]MCU7821721.1 glycosyltransferase [Kitasatospora sp. DSM 101779]